MIEEVFVARAWISRRRALCFAIPCVFLLACALRGGGLRETAAQNTMTGPVAQVGRYEKFELTFPYTGNYSNPNDPSIVDVEAVFTAPDGGRQIVPGFFFQNFTRSGSVRQEILTPVAGSASWKVRYAPALVGTYTYSVTLKDSLGTSTLGGGAFNVSSSTNPGFIRAVGRHFTYDNGSQFVPLGVNAPWFQYGQEPFAHQWGDGTFGVDAMYKQFATYGLNFFHLWTCSWVVGNTQPFAKPNIGCDGSLLGTPQMSQTDSWEMDYMLDQAHAGGIYIMPILKHHDQREFTAADRIKARYFVARWGYSTNIMAWDFNKEGGINPAANHAWAAFMAALDPFGHLRTTSQWNHFPTLSRANLKVYTQIFSDPLMSVIQNHDYQKDCADPLDSDTSLYLFQTQRVDANLLAQINKPAFIGETGVASCNDAAGGKSIYYQSDQHGLILKGEIWGSLMSSPGVFAPWYFAVDPQGNWSQLVGFKAASAYVAALPFVPDSATTFTSYQDVSQVTSSDARLRVIGRKNATFAMLYVQNTTGTWGSILRDGTTPIPVSANIILKGMQPNTPFSVRWYDSDSGALLKTDSAQAALGGLQIAPPQMITQSMAAIITSGLA